MNVNQKYFSNNRELSVLEKLTAEMVAKSDWSEGEPLELTDLRKQMEVAIQIASEIPGLIFDSIIYEALERKKS